MNTNHPQPSPRQPFPAYPALLCAAAFAALLLWRLALPIGHNTRTAALEQQIRNVPEYRTEAYILDAITRLETLRDRIAAERSAFAAARARLNLALAASGIAAAALAAAAFSTRKPSLPAPGCHPATTPTEPGHNAPPG